jgi:hypothetical protein
MATAENYLRVQLVRDSTEAALRGVGGLYADAAHAFVHTGRLAQAAAAAERGRAVLLSEALDRDRGLADLRRRRPGGGGRIGRTLPAGDLPDARAHGSRPPAR